MKKLMLLAFTACLAFAAQALTLNWFTGAGETVSDRSVVPSGVSGLVESCSFAFVLTFNTLDVAADINEIARMGQWNGGNTYLKFWSENDDFGYTGTFKNSKGSLDYGNTLGTKQTFLFVMTYENVGNKILANGWIENQQVYTNKESTNMNGLTVWVNENSAYTLKSSAAYSGVLSAEQIAWMANNQTAVVPEPTALALLALGVAGLALKRKVA